MINGLVRQIMSQIATGDVHQLHEMADATAGIALARENARMEGENGAGLEIAAIETDETETEMGAGPKTERGAPVGSATRIDEAMHPKALSSANVRAPDLRIAMAQRPSHPLGAPRVTAKILDREMMGVGQLAHNEDRVATRMRWTST